MHLRLFYAIKIYLLIVYINCQHELLILVSHVLIVFIIALHGS